MEYVLVRHAHRDKPGGGAEDNGLSEKGKRQARRIRKFYDKRFSEGKVLLWSSPKVRCQETLAPLAEDLKSEIEIIRELDEQSSKETDAEFRARIDRFFEKCRSVKAQRIVFCTHGDWIPAAMQKLFQQPIDLSKGGWIEWEENPRRNLTWIVQKIMD